MSYPPPPGPPGYPPPAWQPGYPPPAGQPPAGNAPPGAPPPPGYPPPGGLPPGYPPGAYGTPPPPGGSSKAVLFVVGGVALIGAMVVLGAAVLFLRGGGDGDVELSRSQAEGALLTAQDAGSGFTETPATDAEPFRQEDIDGDQACLDLIAELDSPARPLAERSLANQSGNTSVEVEHSIDNTRSDRAASVAELRRFVEECDEFTFETAEQTGRFEVERADDPADVGRERVTTSLRVTFTVPFDAEVRLLITVWERSGVRSSLSLSGALSGETFRSEAPDEALLADLLERADERLEEAIDEAR